MRLAHYYKFEICRRTMALICFFFIHETRGYFKLNLQITFLLKQNVKYLQRNRIRFRKLLNFFVLDSFIFLFV